MNLIEREGELLVIDGLLARAAAGDGSVLVVEGTAGIGKTALFDAARGRAAGHAVTPLTARGGELKRDFGFAIVRQLFESLIHAEPAETRTELLSGAAHLAAPACGTAPTGPDAAATGAVVHGLYWLCSNLTERGPLLLTVDDAHWCDEASLRFVSHLARRISDLPVLLVLATRPAPPGRSGPVDRALSGVRPETVRPAPLSGEAVGALVRQALSADADEAFCRACAKATAGNPFLLSEALAGLRGEGVRPVAAQAHRIEAMRPETITRAVLTRLARIGPDAVCLARCLAVLGPAAELRRLAKLADLGLERTADLVDALLHDGLVTAGPPIRFTHPLVRSAVHDDTAEAVRAVTHKRAALMLSADGVPPEQLVPHLLAAAPAADPWIVDELRAAAAAALARGAPEPAVTCLERAVAEPAPAGLRAELLVQLGRTLGMLNRAGEAAQRLQEALDLTVEPADRFDLTMDLGQLMVMAGHGQRPRSSSTRRDVSDPPSTDRSPATSSAASPGAGSRQWSLPRPGCPSSTPSPPTSTGTTTTDWPWRHWRSARQRPGTGPAARWPDSPPSRASARCRPSHGSSSTWPARPSPSPTTCPPLSNCSTAAARLCGDSSAFSYLSVLRSYTALYAGRLLEAEAACSYRRVHRVMRVTASAGHVGSVRSVSGVKQLMRQGDHRGRPFTSTRRARWCRTRRCRARCRNW